MQPLDPLWWMNTDILSLPDHFGTLPDLFDQAIGFIGGGLDQTTEGAVAVGASAQQPGQGQDAASMSLEAGGGVSAVGSSSGGGGAPAGAAGTQTPIGPNGLFDLRSFLEGGGISTL